MASWLGRNLVVAARGREEATCDKGGVSGPRDGIGRHEGLGPLPRTRRHPRPARGPAPRSVPAWYRRGERHR